MSTPQEKAMKDFGKKMNAIFNSGPSKLSLYQEKRKKEQMASGEWQRNQESMLKDRAAHKERVNAHRAKLDAEKR